jgi:hypothetical protein
LWLYWPPLLAGTLMLHIIQRARQTHYRPCKRLSAFLVVLCWLLFNSQLVLAAHPCNPISNAANPQRVISAQSQAMPGMDMSSDNGAEPDTQKLLCDKHCTGDMVKQDHDAQPLVALPVQTELAVPDVDADSQLATAHWSTPPIAGPPAEIVFCRFRE